MSVLLLLAAIALAEPSSTVAGVYATNQMEMAGALELRPDGRFRYVFDYGAVSEEAEGNWSVDGPAVQLTTNPMPPPAECDRGFASACFKQTPLAIDGKTLILIRWDARIVLRPVQPRE